MHHATHNMHHITCNISTISTAAIARGAPVLAEWRMLHCVQVISRFFVAQGGLAAQSVPIARLMKETTLRAERSGHMQVFRAP